METVRPVNTRRGWTERMSHGTDNGYSNGGCRCEPCTTAHREVRREREHRTGRAYPWDLYIVKRRLGLPT